MNNTVGNILNFFADTSKTFGTRAGTVTVSIFLLIILDLLSGLTYNFQTNNKLSQLDKVQKLMLVHSTDIDKVTSLKEMEAYILQKRHYSEVISGWFNSLTRPTDEVINQPISAKGKGSVLNLGLMIISSSYGCLLSLLILMFVPFSKGLKGITREGFQFMDFLGVTMLLAFLAGVITSIAYLIPVIDEKRPYWNYGINFLIHTFFLVLIGRYGAKDDSKTEKSTPKIPKVLNSSMDDPN